jgi:lipoyl(octanoyl) transferase
VRAPLQTEWLGRVAFGDAFARQEQLVQEVSHGERGDTLLLLEHDPVYTIGRTPDQTSLRLATILPHPVVQINRGGQATYHGPGQLIGYPILNLNHHGNDLHRYLRWLEDLLIDALTNFGIAAVRRESLTGVWVENRKIASIGVGVRRWISMHGFALNVCGDLTPFDKIIPCGIAGVQMTSIVQETGREVTVEDAARKIGALFSGRLTDL